MTDRMKFGDGKVVFEEESFGGIDTAKLTVNNDQLREYEVYLDIEGTVPLDEFVITTDSGELELDVSSFRTATVDIRKTDAQTEDNNLRELTQNLQETKRKNMPPIPDAAGLKTQTDKTHYKRLAQNPDSQPAKYRRLIRNEGEMARPKFDRWAERQDLDPTGGSHDASLLMLERIGEIDRRGRGDNQMIVWVGN